MNSKKQIIIISIVSGIILLILIFLFLFPLLKQVKNSSSEFVEVKKKIALFESRIDGIDRLKTTYDDIKEDLEKTDRLLIDSDVPIELIKFLEGTAAESNLSIRISPSSPKKSDNDRWDFIGFRLSLEGSFNGFMRFLEKIETAPYLIEVQDLSIKKSVSVSDNVSAILIMKVFVK